MIDSNDDRREPVRTPASGGPLGPRLSSLAVVAMVVACLPCPPVSLLGAVLGLMALGRIRQADGKLRGMKLARTAIIVGILVSLASVLLLSYLRDHLERGQERAISKSVHVFLTQAANGNASGALSHWDLKGTPISVEDVEAFGASVESRLGPLKSLQVGKVVPANDLSLLQPRVDAWVILEFQAGTRNGSGRFVLIPEMGTLTFDTKLRGFRIEDPAGVLAIPSEPPEASEEPAEEPVEGDQAAAAEPGPA